MNSFPGTGSFATTQLPINVLGPDVLGATATDRGSTPVAATSPQLANLISETPTDTYLVGDGGVGGSDFTRLKFEVDLEDIYAIFAAILFFQIGLDGDDNPEWFHWIEAVHGLYKVGPQNTNTIASNIALDPIAALTDGTLSSNAIAGITDGNVHIGLQVGGQDKTFNYPRTVHAICIVGTGLGQLSGWQMFTSQNGRQWTERTKSALSGNGWSSGEKFYAVGSFRNVASTEARVILFNQPVVENYVKIVLLRKPTSAWNLREVLALNRCGDVLASSDFIHATTDVPDTDSVDMTIVRFSPPKTESIPGRTLISGIGTSVELVQAARARVGSLSSQDQAVLRTILTSTGSLTAQQFDVLARSIGRDPSAGEIEAIRLAGQAAGFQSPATPQPQAISAFSSVTSQGPINNSGQFNSNAVATSDTPVTDGTALPVLTMDEAKAIGRSHAPARVIQVDFRPWTPRALRDAQITVSHLEVFNRADDVAFGANGKLQVMRLAGALPGEVADVDDAETLKILNASTDTAKRIVAHIPLLTHTVTGYTFPAQAAGTYAIPDSGRRITGIKVILNAAHDDVGSFGDDSFTVGAAGTALVTEVSDTPNATGEFHVHHEDGTIETFTAFNGVETITVTYADEGSWATEISGDGSAFVKAPTEVTLEGDVPPGGTRDLYVRGNQELFTDNRERSAILLASTVFAGNSEDLEAP